MFDKRLNHALTHKNNLLGGKSWAELDEVVYAFEPQNEPQGVSCSGPLVHFDQSTDPLL